MPLCQGRNSCVTWRKLRMEIRWIILNKGLESMKPFRPFSIRNHNTKLLLSIWIFSFKWRLWLTFSNERLIKWLQLLDIKYCFVFWLLAKIKQLLVVQLDIIKPKRIKLFGKVGDKMCQLIYGWRD